MTETKTTKQKIDEILGIDDFLEDLDKSSTEIEDTMSGLSEEVKSSLNNIDALLSSVKEHGDIGPLTLTDLSASMREVEDLIATSKKMFLHIYLSIISTDLLDSELIAAAAKMLESIHINIAEFLNMYKERQRFIDKIKLLVFQLSQKRELMELKHKHDIEKMKLKAELGVIDVNTDQVIFDLNKIIGMLDEVDNEESLSNDIES